MIANRSTATRSLCVLIGAVMCVLLLLAWNNRVLIRKKDEGFVQNSIADIVHGDSSPQRSKSNGELSGKGIPRAGLPPGDSRNDLERKRDSEELKKKLGIRNESVPRVDVEIGTIIE